MRGEGSKWGANLALSTQMMHEAFQCRLSVLRALYEASGEDLDQFIMSSEQ